MSVNSMQKNIDKAQTAINMNRDAVAAGKMRQKYHFMPPAGWLNDPNGLIEYKGKYHLFYQHNPYDGFWSCMHWGHAVSEDLVHWEYLPIALAPSESYDDHKKGGCFSGSAVEHDGKLYLIYTGTSNHGRGYEQVQCVACSEDGIHFEKYSGNPVLSAPEGIPTDFFRDPKVWKKDDTFYMVCGARKKDYAQALLYRSKDLLNWEFFNVLAESRGEWGYMWECPDFFQIGEKFVLMFSPMGAGERTCTYLLGDFSYETGKFNYEICGEIDWGFDYYAPQSFEDSKGRRIIIAWANAWDWMPFWKDWGPTYREGWCGSFAVPREVKLNADHTLSFVPVEEMKSIRLKPFEEHNITIGSKPWKIPAANGVSCEIEVEVDLQKTDADAFSLLLRADETHNTEVRFDLKRQMMSVSRERADDWSLGASSSPLLMKDKEKLHLRVFLDQSSVEVFAEGGRTNHSLNIYASEEQDSNYLIAENGKLCVRVLKTWELKQTMDLEFGE